MTHVDVSYFYFTIAVVPVPGETIRRWWSQLNAHYARCPLQLCSFTPLTQAAGEPHSSKALLAMSFLGCYDQCLGQGVLDGTCGTTDFECICEPTFITGYESCLSTTCSSPSDISTAQQSFRDFCAETGHILSTSLSAPAAPTSTTPTSTTKSRTITTTSPFINIPTFPGTSNGNDNSGQLKIIIAAVLGGAAFLFPITFVVIRHIMRRRQVRKAMNTQTMLQAANQNSQPQSPPVMAYQPPQPPPSTNPPYVPSNEPSPAWTSQDTTNYNTQANTSGYNSVSYPLAYPGAYPTSSSQSYGNSYSNLNYPAQPKYIPPGTQIPVRLEYPGPIINTQTFNADGFNYYPPPATASQPSQSTISSYYSSGVKTALSSTSEQHPLRSPAGVPQSTISSPPLTPAPPSSQTPSVRPEAGDGATGFQITNLHEMDGSDDVQGRSSANRESIQPGSDGPSGGFRITNVGGPRPSPADTQDTSREVMMIL
ncbi:hypothetical protein BJ165DRAFT_1524407 [Panaeolus papilionaceus]|nr:hypothetical protein BJ165DRAFT_1524407 [Panaeolus papilionaceus]